MDEKKFFLIFWYPGIRLEAVVNQVTCSNIISLFDDIKSGKNPCPVVKIGDSYFDLAKCLAIYQQDYLPQKQSDPDKETIDRAVASLEKLTALNEKRMQQMDRGEEWRGE